LNLFRLIDILLFTIERIRQHLLLVLWVVVGLSVATTLALSLPLYVDSVYSDILNTRLDEPPYNFRFRYLGAWNGNITAEDMTNASAAIQQGFTRQIGLDVIQNVKYVRGGSWQVRTETNQPLGTYGISFLNGSEDKYEIVQGEWPPQVPWEEGQPYPALLPETALYSAGINVGDILIAQRAGTQPAQVQIVAMWRPYNNDDPAWVFPPKFFDNVLLTEEDNLWKMLESTQGQNPIDEVAWQLIFDGSELRTAEIDSLIKSIEIGVRDVDIVLPGVRQDVAPTENLIAFSEEVNALSLQLFIIILPVGGLVLYFVSLVANLLVSRQQSEDVKLRSRGMSRSNVLWIHIQMWLVLVGIALGVGIVVSPYIVRLVGQTISFLEIDSTAPILAVTFTPEAVVTGAVTGLIAASSGLFLAWKTTRQNINSFRQASVRGGKAWWQKAYLDLLILLPAGYVLYNLNQEGGLSTNADTPFSDPLTFIGPTLFALGATLLFLRLLPMVLGLFARMLSYTRNMTLLMALRELTRSEGRYRGALLMMAFTLSLTGFTASMASTIDRSLVDSINYAVGADLVIVTASDAQTDTGTDDSGAAALTVTGYNAPPIQDLRSIEDLYAVSRFGAYTGRLVVRSSRLDGQIIGIDRADIAAVTRWREDYATDEIGALFNQLAGNRTGVLLDRNTVEELSIAIGQEVTLQVQALGSWYETRVPVIDVFDYFPTTDPREGFILITNIDPLFEVVGTELPQNVWLGLKDGVTVDEIRAQVGELNFPVLRWLDPEETLRVAQAQPARRGVLGFLSVGFVASIVLTLIGTIIQSTASFRAQSAQIGTLRAMGLGGIAVLIYMILLQGMIAVSGILSGTSIGVLTTLLYLPLLDFSGGLPPYLVRVAWEEIILVYSVFAGVLFFVTLFISLALSREQLSQVVKLGDT
jgi:putative ABC transport system permease protein